MNKNTYWKNQKWKEMGLQNKDKWTRFLRKPSSVDIETTEQRLEAIKLLPNKKQKRQTDTPSPQMVQF